VITGLHAPNASWTSEDRCRLRVSGLQAVELMAPHTTEADVVQLRGLGVSYFLMRLPDSVEGATGRWKGDHEYANECIGYIKRFYPLGVRDYQLDNEPNLVWPEGEAHSWRFLLNLVVRLIRSSPDVPRDVRLGLAPLSWTPATWASVENVWIPQQRMIQDMHNFVCVHSYWQKGKHYNDPSFGGNVTHWHDSLLGSSRPYVITEWASSVHEVPGVTPQEAEALRIMQYPQWLRWVAERTYQPAQGTSYVESAFLYIVGGTTDWVGFHPSDKILRSLEI